jgi:hypothetical protein
MSPQFSEIERRSANRWIGSWRGRRMSVFFSLRLGGVFEAVCVSGNAT